VAITTGPKDKTVVDFWRMIWEEQVAVIVMVTRCVELGKRKCAQYWPESDTGSAKHGHYAISVAGVQSCVGYDARTLTLTFKVYCSRRRRGMHEGRGFIESFFPTVQGAERTVMHFQFLAWPDYGIPSSGSSILDLIFAVREAQTKHSVRGTCPPIVVHCSAGVGRSGAFCTIDNCIHELDKMKKVNLQGTVRKMRKQRAFSVQTEEQYEFCYRTLLEYSKQ
jgi:tyrosine-protein phosphatase non-receptor type 9